MPFPDLPPDRIPGSPGHLHDHQLIDQALDYVKTAAYKDDPDFPPLPDIPVLGQSGHVTAHDRIRAILDYVKEHPAVGNQWAKIGNNPTGTYTDSQGHSYAYYTFTKSGTLTVTTAGLVDFLVVGAGGQGATFQAGPGGRVQVGMTMLDAASTDVKVADDPKKGSRLGDIIAAPSAIDASLGRVIGAGAMTSGDYTGISSSITGTPDIYGPGANPKKYGGGAANGQGPANGVVIVRTRTS